MLIIHIDHKRRNGGDIVAITLFNKITQYFANREYEKIPTDSENVAMFGIYDKSNLYLINVIDLQEGYGLDPERYLEYKQMTMQRFADDQSDKIVLLNIILSDHTDVLLEDFNFVPDMSEQFIDVLWFVNRGEEQLVIPKKQLKSVLGIGKDLKRLLKDEETTYYSLDKNHGLPIVTGLFMLINIGVWLWLEFIGSSTDVELLRRAGALNTTDVLNGEYLRIIQSMFIHIGFLHLFYNMFGLYIFGYRLEKYLSRWQLVTIYMVSGIVGSLFSLTGDLMVGRFVISAGASGAIYGLMGSLLVISRIVKKPIDGVTTYVLFTMFALGIVYSVLTPGINILAHLGGFVGGVVMTLVLLRTSKKTDLEGA